MIHYKDRDPKDTINIIEKFFISKNLKLNEIDYHQSEANTFSCRYELLYNNKSILKTNGKGTTAVLSKASCLAEMYERFCATQEDICNNIFSYFKYQEFNMEKNHFHIAKDEQIIEDISTDRFFQDSFFYQLNNDQNIFLQNFYKVPYVHLNNPKETVYYSPYFLKLVDGTNGLAAGNTKEEALVQGISEIFERYGMELFFSHPHFRYYYLNSQYFSDYIKEIIALIEQTNKKVFIFDLSYNYHIPVIMSIVQDISKHFYHIHFGAAPIIDIAIERCLTEIYQGKSKLFPTCYNLTASNNISWDNILYNLNLSFEKPYVSPILENIILYSAQKDEYNHKYFLKEAQDNQTLLTHLLNIGLQNNIDFYYRDLSLDNNMYAVRIITNKRLSYYLIQKYKTTFSKLTNIKKDFIYKEYIELIQQIKNNSLSLSFLNTQKDKYSKNIFIFIYSLLYCDLFDPINIQLFEIDHHYQLLATLLYDKNINQNMVQNEIYYNKIQPYLLINNYINNNLYSQEDIQKILLFFNYPSIEIKKYNSNDIIEKVFIKDLLNTYNSEEYNNFIKLFIK